MRFIIIKKNGAYGASASTRAITARRWLLREGDGKIICKKCDVHQPRHHRLQRRLQPDTAFHQVKPGKIVIQRPRSTRCRAISVSAEKGKGVPCSS